MHQQFMIACLFGSTILWLSRRLRRLKEAHTGLFGSIPCRQMLALYRVEAKDVGENFRLMFSILMKEFLHRPIGKRQITPRR